MSSEEARDAAWKRLTVQEQAALNRYTQLLEEEAKRMAAEKPKDDFLTPRGGKSEDQRRQETESRYHGQHYVDDPLGGLSE